MTDNKQLCADILSAIKETCDRIADIDPHCSYARDSIGEAHDAAKKSYQLANILLNKVENPHMDFNVGPKND